MTIEEQATHMAIQGIHRKMKDLTQIDWEQRRYEVAKKCMPYALHQEIGNLERAAEVAVKCADVLITELKKNI